MRNQDRSGSDLVVGLTALGFWLTDRERTEKAINEFTPRDLSESFEAVQVTEDGVCGGCSGG